MKFTISAEVLESCLFGAQESHPNEFLGLLAGSKGKEIILADRLYLAPLTQSDEGSVSFDEFNMPIAMGVVGTFHSHPSGPALPSRADLKLFSQKGACHLIASFPYKRADVRCFDSKGKEMPFVVV
ncbi:MAG: Mov34/MPN/PAD-1 family protein [Candidatus Micrarchaeia archaeon]|jgi:proteasome lid subunit RPN8/RPN11